MAGTPDVWDARNTLHAMQLWADGKINLGQFIELCKEIYVPYMDMKVVDDDDDG